MSVLIDLICKWCGCCAGIVHGFLTTWHWLILCLGEDNDCARQQNVLLSQCYLVGNMRTIPVHIDWENLQKL